mmetsp:Transcript_65301/g.76716  ORF Transcript_65301/g.76716 Transcript_65301/m.76716 type:complete len:227 (+) Transcript_65301:920-1600(+)
MFPFRPARSIILRDSLSAMLSCARNDKSSTALPLPTPFVSINPPNRGGCKCSPPTPPPDPRKNGVRNNCSGVDPLTVEVPFVFWPLAYWLKYSSITTRSRSMARSSAMRRTRQSRATHNVPDRHRIRSSGSEESFPSPPSAISGLPSAEEGGSDASPGSESSCTHIRKTRNVMNSMNVEEGASPLMAIPLMPAVSDVVVLFTGSGSSVSFVALFVFVFIFEDVLPG